MVDYPADGSRLTGRLVDLSQVARRGRSSEREADVGPDPDTSLDELESAAGGAEE